MLRREPRRGQLDVGTFERRDVALEVGGPHRRRRLGRVPRLQPNEIGRRRAEPAERVRQPLVGECAGLGAAGRCSAAASRAGLTFATRNVLPRRAGR